MRLQGSVHPHPGGQAAVVLVVEKVAQAIDLAQQGEAGVLLVKLRQPLLPAGRDGTKRTGGTGSQRKGLGCTPAPFPTSTSIFGSPTFSTAKCGPGYGLCGD